MRLLTFLSPLVLEHDHGQFCILVLALSLLQHADMSFVAYWLKPCLRSGIPRRRGPLIWVAEIIETTVSPIAKDGTTFHEMVGHQEFRWT